LGVENETLEVPSLSEAALNWMQSEPQQVFVIVACYLIAFVMIKKDHLG
jgi:hypothetical protein